MKRSLLLADDSLTIQKVVQITLSSYPFSIVNIDTIDKLTSYLSEAKPELILLDFSLDKEIDGYTLCSQVKQLSPKSNIVILYGTFDEPDMEKLDQAGAKDYLVKPFDGEKFVQTCLNYTQVLDESEDHLEMDEEVESLENFEESDFNESFDLDQWKVDETDYQLPTPLNEISFDEGLKESFEYDEIRSEDLSTDEVQSDLDKELEEWGMKVPGVIEEEVHTEAGINTEEEVMDSLINEELDASFESLKIDVESIENNQENLSHLLSDIDIPLDSAESIVEEKVIKHFSDENIEQENIQLYLEKEGRDIIEKIAWEIIPDLAENIIREEFKKAMRLMGKD